jgi:hypothetical protein
MNGNKHFQGANMSDGITEASRKNDYIDYNSNIPERIGELQIYMSNLLIKNILSPETLQQIVDKSINNYDIHRNKMIYKKIKGELDEN